MSSRLTESHQVGYSGSGPTRPGTGRSRLFFRTAMQARIRLSTITRINTISNPQMSLRQMHFILRQRPQHKMLDIWMENPQFNPQPVFQHAPWRGTSKFLIALCKLAIKPRSPAPPLIHLTPSDYDKIRGECFMNGFQVGLERGRKDGVCKSPRS